MAELWAELVEKTCTCVAHKELPIEFGLTARVVRRIAEELELNISASMEDTRQIVGGKIVDGTKTAKRAG